MAHVARREGGDADVERGEKSIQQLHHGAAQSSSLASRAASPICRPVALRRLRIITGSNSTGREQSRWCDRQIRAKQVRERRHRDDEMVIYGNELMRGWRRAPASA